MTAEAGHSFAPNHDEVLEALAESRHYNDWLFERARPYLGRRVLDAGAGMGTFVALAREAGAEVTALEPHGPFAALLAERFAGDSGVRVVQGEVERMDELGLDGPFDSVICFNVLEHVRDHVRALRALHDVLAPGGRLLLLVPAHPALYGEVDRSIGHERRYRRDELARMLEGTGFAVETLRHVNPVGAAGWLVRVRLRRRRDWPVSSFKAFDRVVPLLRRLDAVPLPFGLSLWAVALAMHEPRDEMQ